MTTNVSLDQVVNVSISVTSSGASQKGFGKLLFVTAEGTNTTIKYYSTAAELLADGFLANSDTVEALNTWYAQNPKPVSASFGVLTSSLTNVVADVTTARGLDDSWYWTSLDSTLGDPTNDVEIDAYAAYIEAQIAVLGVNSDEAAMLTSGDTTNIAYKLKDTYSRTFVTYDSNDKFPSISAMARASTVNFLASNSALTLKFKRLPSIQPESLSTTQYKNLKTYNANAYLYVSDYPMFTDGVMTDGTWIDQVHGVDWLRSYMQTEVFNFLATRSNKVPQTDGGMEALAQRVERCLEQARKSGLVAAGTWNGTGIGAITTTPAYLPNGYYVYVDLVANQSTADRNARKAMPIQWIAKLAGAVHAVDIVGSIEQ